MKKIHKKLISITSLFLMFAMLAMFGSATSVALDTPANSASITGNYNFTATITFTDTFNVSNCTFATTDDGVFGKTELGNASVYWNYSNTASLTETASTTVTVTCSNYSMAAVNTITDPSTSVAIDNTNPVCGCQLGNDLIDLHREIDYDCRNSDDTTPLTYSVVATYDDATTETKTASKGSFENTQSLGQANIVATVTDAVSKTNVCSTMSVTIKGDGDDVVSKKTQAQTGDNKAAIILLFLIVAAVAAVTAATKKKRR